MKKTIILSLCLLFASVTMVIAQRAAARKAEITKGLKEDVKLTDAQVTSVLAIEDEFRPKLRAIKSDSTMNETDKKAKSKAINDEKKAKIEQAVGKETALKVEAFYTTLKKGGKDEAAPATTTKKSGGKKKAATTGN